MCCVLRGSGDEIGESATGSNFGDRDRDEFFDNEL
jgi:hypothetical protein